MELTENLFHQLIGKTGELLRIFKSPVMLETFDEADDLFVCRDELLKQLDKNLQLASNTNQYSNLYEEWQAQELELRSIVKGTIQELDQKIESAKNLHSQSQSNSNKYDSYLKQMPYGAFLDKKR